MPNDTEISALQARVSAWIDRTFSKEHRTDPRVRSDRFMEEATELFQAMTADRERAHDIVDYVFDRPIGEPCQELGGVVVTAMGLTSCMGEDLSELSHLEVSRVESKSKAHFAARDSVKKIADYKGDGTCGLSWLPRSAMGVIALKLIEAEIHSSFEKPELLQDRHLYFGRCVYEERGPALFDARITLHLFANDLDRRAMRNMLSNLSDELTAADQYKTESPYEIESVKRTYLDVFRTVTMGVNHGVIRLKIQLKANVPCAQ